MPDRIAEWAKDLGELCALGDALARAIDANDAIAALTASHQARGVRARLVANAPSAPTTPDEVRALGAARALASSARYAEVMLDRWRARALPPDAELATTPLGAAALADVVLPATWDADADVCVLIGPGWEVVLDILSALGQRRVVVLDGGAAATPGAIAVADLDELAAAVRTMDPVPPQRFAVRGLGDAARARTSEVADVVGGVLADLRVHRNTVAAFSRTWIAQGARNLRHVARWPSIGAIGDRLAGVPMIIAAPGPSLAKNVGALRAAKGKAIIAALSHSLRPLLAAGVVPDLVFTVDPQDVRYHFAGADLGAMTLVSGVTVHPALYELGAPRCLTLAANCALDHWMYEGLDERPEAAGGGSVATTAFTVALRWRCEPIAVVGLDLSFPGGKYYVDSSVDGGAHAVVEDGVVKVKGWSDGFHDMKKQGGPQAPRERAVELPGWHGGTVPSSFMFSMFHRWFVEQAGRAQGVRLLNCTEGGAFIEGMAHVPLAALLEELAARPAVDVGAVVDEVIAQVDVAGRTQRTARRAEAVAGAIRRAAKLAARCAKLAAVAGHDAGAEQHLARHEAELVRELRELGFVSMLAQRDIARALTAAGRVTDAEQALAASRALFGAVVAAAREVAPHLDEAARALRQAERDGAGAGKRAPNDEVLRAAR